MLLHLPIVILATPSPTAVSDQVPKFDTARERRYEAGGATVIDRCSRDESTALGQLKTRWRQFGDADKRTCVLDAAALTGRNSPIGDEPMPLVGVELPVGKPAEYRAAVGKAIQQAMHTALKVPLEERLAQ